MINCLYIEKNGRCSNENSVCYQGKCEFEEGCEVCTTHRVYKILGKTKTGETIVTQLPEDGEKNELPED